MATAEIELLKEIELRLAKLEPAQFATELSGSLQAVLALETVPSSAAHFALENCPLLTQGLLQTIGARLLCVDAASFEKLTFLFTLNRHRGAMHDILETGMKLCPTTVAKHLDFYMESVSWEDYFRICLQYHPMPNPKRSVSELLKEVKEHLDLIGHSESKESYILSLQRQLKDTNKVHPENKAFLDGLLVMVWETFYDHVDT